MYGLLWVKFLCFVCDGCYLRCLRVWEQGIIYEFLLFVFVWYVCGICCLCFGVCIGYVGFDGVSF